MTPTATAAAPVTVDPSQVYDRSAEIQREAAKAEDARKAEEDRRKAKEEFKRREDNENSRGIAEARKLSQNATEKKPNQKKSRKFNAGKNDGGDAAANAAAMTLLQTANAGSAGDAGDLEAQMRAMFTKMREFNSKNPELLSKLWQQERESYLAGETDKPQPQPKTLQGSNEASRSAPPKVVSDSKDKKKRTPKKDSQNKASKTPSSAESHQAPNQLNETSKSKAVSGIPSTPAPPKQPEKANMGKTVWPEKRKAQLAQAASSLIVEMPENTGRTIRADEIARILDGNPSYLELCNQIEARGFRLNKSHFAKALLTAVPDVNKTKTHTSTSSPQVFEETSFAPVNGGSPSNGVGQEQPLNAIGDAEKRLMSGESLIGKSSHEGRPRKLGETPRRRTFPWLVQTTDDGSTPSNNMANNSHLEGLDAVKQFNERPGTEKADSNYKVLSPATENKKSKKQGPSNTPALALPQTKEDLARKRTFEDLVDLTQISDDEVSTAAKRAQLHRNAQSTTPTEHFTQVAIPPGAATVSSPKAPVVPAMGTSNQQQPQGPRPLLGQPGHLQNYPQPTFHPPTPGPGQNKPTTVVPRDHPINNILVGEKIAKSKVARRSKYNSKTIARDVLLACGRHPDMRHLNAHLDVLRHLRLKDDVDLSTVRWDVIDPGGALPGACISTGPLPEDELDDMADDESSDNDSILGTRAIQSIPIGAAAAAAVAVESGRSAPHPHRVKPYQSRKSDLGIRRHADGTPNKPAPTITPASAPKSGGYAALRAISGTDANGENQPKKRGRPVGWRKWMQKGADGTAPAPPPNGAPRRGRAPGSETKAPKPPSPQFPAFKCEWEACAAELHNLATLRRHLHKVHRSSSGEHECRWKGCGQATAVKEGPRTVSKFVRRTFGEAKDWEAHLEDEHLLQVKWAQGDGPAAGLSDNNGEVSDAVLSDREGRQVTPRIAMPGSPAEAMQRAEEERSRGSQGPAPDGSGRRRRTPLEEAQMELYSAEEKRRRLGVGIDKGGGTMVTDKQRRGFVEDGDVEMVDDE